MDQNVDKNINKYCWQVPHCYPLKEVVVAHLYVLLGSSHSASLASAQAHAGNSEADQRSSRRLPHDRKSVPCPWSSSTLPRTSSRFCRISAPGSWTNPLWPAGAPRSALAYSAIVCLSAWKQSTDAANARLAYMTDASSGSTQSELLFGPAILTGYQTSWHRIHAVLPMIFCALRQ